MTLAFLQRFRERIKGGGGGYTSKIRRRRRLTNFFWRSSPTIISCLLFIGYSWMLVIPLPLLGQKTYIDENALQPGQVNTYWNWDEVHRADRYLAELERLRDENATSELRSQYLATEFEKIGVLTSTQRYSFVAASGSRNGTNAYAVLSSPRAAGSEAMVISASWLSRSGDGDGTLNLRGVASVLSLAAFLKGHSLWAKDVIFVISDGYLDGMQAWISAYHGASQSNIHAEPLSLTAGVIWTALNIDYPGHSFSHLGVFFEGLNGRLPNQDLINSFQLISRYTGGVPVVVYDHMEPRDFPSRQHEFSGLPSWLPDTLKQNDDLNEYGYRVKNILRHVSYQARGKASGVHGLLHQFRIDAITLFAVPAPGPHGFHAIGRIVESILRTSNNLLERLHASFFFYLLVGPTAFLKIGSYLPGVIVISMAMLLAGLKEWSNAGWIWSSAQSYRDNDKDTNVAVKMHEHWSRRERPILQAVKIIIATHALGIAVFYSLLGSWFQRNQLFSVLVFGAVIAIPPIILELLEKSLRRSVSLCMVLKAFNLCLASAVTSVISVLNFSLAAVCAVLLGLPLCFSKTASPHASAALYIAHCFLAFGWLVLHPDQVRSALADWELLGVWFAPFVCIVYAPIVLQTAIVYLLAV